MRPAKPNCSPPAGAGLFRPIQLVPQSRLRRDVMLVDAAGVEGVWRVAGARSPWRLLRRRHSISEQPPTGFRGRR